MITDVENTRIAKLGKYLETILEELNSKYKKINADFLGLEVNNYSLDKIPTASTVEEWLIGTRVCRDVYSFRSRNPYSSDRLNNLKNIGFFEEFESIIKTNNDKGILPEIDNIEKIECLNCGAFNNADASGKTATFDIQLQITYRED
nr:MAG TPA: Minor capsid protein from bacteriophage [Caudoviricetes sp.]